MKKRVILNIACTTLCQLMTLISGLIVPRLILSTFGSEANGLVSSLTQFLNYISLVEGGIGSVVLTALYSPLAKKDNSKLSGVLKAAEKFFRQIAYICDLYNHTGMRLSNDCKIKFFVAFCGIVNVDSVIHIVHSVFFFYYIQAFDASRSKNVYRTTMAGIDYVAECSSCCCVNKSVP